MTAGRSNLTCYCSSYPHPHRFLSGKCGSWEHVLKVWDEEHAACHECQFAISAWNDDERRHVMECKLLDSKPGERKPTDCLALAEPQPKEKT